MTLEEMKDNAITKVTADNPNCTGFKVAKTYENLMDGTLITVAFVPSGGKEDSNHVHFGKDDIRTYRWHSDALNAVANYKERSPFFRLLELIGIGGLIALILVLIFSILLGVLAFTSSTQNPVNTSIVDVIKLSFTLILGYFFGQSTKK
jgi:hypothetical protein